MRLFAALDPDDAVCASLAGFLQELGQSELSRNGGVRWTRPDSLHLTLKFIGEQPEERIPAIVSALEKIPVSGALDLRFEGFGCFPNYRRPRVFWAGIREDARLSGLAGSVESALETLGIAREDRPFRPHLTLGRVKEGSRFPAARQLVDQYAARDFGATQAREYYLYQSRLSPGGSKYTRLQAFPLAAKG